MPPVQNTFSIIPDAPSVLNGHHDDRADGTNTRTSRPPMTSKQVKKAYKKANKGPKLSKAEQRRLELFEQDRIRKEFEKERNQARARAARDKKKQREEEKRAEKKKKGLPLVDVRPSQDTIARFVRAKPKNLGDRNLNDENTPPLRRGEHRSRSSSPAHSCPDSSNSDQGLELDDTEETAKRKNTNEKSAVPVNDSHEWGDDPPILGADDDDNDDAEPLSKKRRVDVIEEEDEDDDPFPVVADEVVSLSLKRNPNLDPKVDIVRDHAEGLIPTLGPEPEQKQKQEQEQEPEPVEQAVDDSDSTMDMSEESLFDDLLREMEARPDGSSTPLEKSLCVSEQLQDLNPPIERSPSKPPEKHVPSPKKNERLLASLDQVAKPKKPSSPYPKIARQIPVPKQAERVMRAPPFALSPTSSTQKSQPIAPEFHHPRTPMAPPSVPPKFKSSRQVSVGSPRTPQFVKPPLPPPRTPAIGPGSSRMPKPKQAPENEPPPSTQLFVLNHLDDFFPSPSQEVREIFEEPLRKSIDRRASKPNPNIPKTLAAPYNRSVTSTSGSDPKSPRRIQQITDLSEPGPRKVPAQPSIQPTPQNTLNAFEMPFFCTQDLLLSSQDVKDIEEDPLPLPKAQSSIPPPPVSMPPKENVKPRDAPRRSPKRLFTSSLRELRYKYAIELNRTAAWEGPSARQKAREELDSLQALEDERLEALLANPSEEMDTMTIHAPSNKQPTTHFHGTPTPQPPGPARPDKSVRSSLPSSPPIPEGKASNVQKPLDARGPGLGPGGGEIFRRSTRPKGSYEAMLELLAKGPKQKSGARPDMLATDRNNKYREANKSKGGYPDQKDDMPKDEFCAMMTTISASQETDYDGGEEWDDDDLLRGIL
ncbi:hypothetical protein GGR51DRAFT_241288 [Nemania sp. FL0031]|nr:hypothetical protein GGR51DRAFT_241288 [Nemania sp. FL0031]